MLPFSIGIALSTILANIVVMTTIEGYLTISRVDDRFYYHIHKKHRNYLRKFCASRRMAFNKIAILNRPDPFREAVCLSMGREGGYYVNNPDDEDGDIGAAHSLSVLDYNRPPLGQPSLHCGWTITKSLLIWTWDKRSTKHFEWLEYLIDHFFKPWQYRVDGTVSWFNDVANNSGDIVVVNNEIKILPYNNKTH